MASFNQQPDLSDTEASPKPEQELDQEHYLVRQWRRLVRLATWAAGISLLLFVALILVELLRLAEVFARIHPMLGWAYVAVLMAVLVLGVGLPAWRYLRLPRVMNPPNVTLEALDHLQRSDVAARARYVQRYCRNLLRNPELESQRGDIRLAIERLAGLRASLQTVPAPDVPKLARRLKEIEADQVEPILRKLDTRADRLIRSEALTVGALTAVSLNGALDTLIVLWRLANLVGRLGQLYYGRPGLRGSLRILRDVGAAILISRVMENLSEAAGAMAGRAGGRWAGLLFGPVVDGLINGIVVLKVGHVAKGRCRCFQAWTEATRRQALQRALAAVAKESAGLATELTKEVAKTGLQVAGRSVRATSDTLLTILRRTLASLSPQRQLPA